MKKRSWLKDGIHGMVFAAIVIIAAYAVQSLFVLTTITMPGHIVLRLFSDCFMMDLDAMRELGERTYSCTGIFSNDMAVEAAVIAVSIVIYFLLGILAALIYRAIKPTS